MTTGNDQAELVCCDRIRRPEPFRVDLSLAQAWAIPALIL